MAFGIFLIFLLLVLSGAIAYIGDRLGRSIGKRRLSLFNLRPRHTSIIITIITGIIITAVTLSVLLLVYAPARQILFKYQSTLNGIKTELKQLQTERDKANADLKLLNRNLTKIQDLLNENQKKLAEAQADVQAVRKERDALQTQFDSLSTEFNNAKATINTFETKAAQLQQEITSLNAQIEKLSAERAALNNEKKAVETQRDKLNAEIETLSSKLQKRYEEFSQLQQEILLGKIIFTADETAGIYGVPPQSTRAELEALFKQVVNDMRKLAKERGAKPGESGDVIVFNEKRVEELIKELQGRAKGSIIIAFSITNVTDGGILVLGLRTMDNDLLFHSSELIAEAVIDGGAGKSEVESALQNLLLTARRLGLARGILPFVGSVGTASAEDIINTAKIILQRNKPVHVQLISAKDTYRLDQMQVEFKILD